MFMYAEVRDDSPRLHLDPTAPKQQRDAQKLSFLMLFQAQVLKSEANDFSKEVLMNKWFFVWDFMYETWPGQRVSAMESLIHTDLYQSNLTLFTGLLCWEALNKKDKLMR